MNKLKALIITCLLVAVAAAGCQSGSKGNETMKQKNFISTKTVEKVSSALIDSLGQSAKFRVERGVKQVAALWVESDGNETEFTQFCRDNFVNDTTITLLRLQAAVMAICSLFRLSTVSKR